MASRLRDPTYNKMLLTEITRLRDSIGIKFPALLTVIIIMIVMRCRHRRAAITERLRDSITNKIPVEHTDYLVTSRWERFRDPMRNRDT